MKRVLFFSFYSSVEFTSRFLLIFLLFHPITLVTVSLFILLLCRILQKNLLLRVRSSQSKGVTFNFLSCCS